MSRHGINHPIWTAGFGGFTLTLAQAFRTFSEKHPMVCSVVLSSNLDEACDVAIAVVGEDSPCWLRGDTK
jgi:hypothetical protein